MVTKTEITVYSAEKKEVIEGQMTLNSVDNSHTFNFDSDNLMLSICLKDVVDLKDFYNMLDGKEKKNILHCTMNNGDKEYKGLRKVILNDNKITVSLGGKRFEFDENINGEFKKIIEGLKAKLGI